MKDTLEKGNVLPGRTGIILNGEAITGMYSARTAFTAVKNTLLIPTEGTSYRGGIPFVQSTC